MRTRLDELSRAINSSRISRLRLRAIEMSQVRSLPASGRTRWYAACARRKVSWVISSAAAVSPTCERQKRWMLGNVARHEEQGLEDRNDRNEKPWPWDEAVGKQEVQTEGAEHRQPSRPRGPGRRRHTPGERLHAEPGAGKPTVVGVAQAWPLSHLRKYRAAGSGARRYLTAASGRVCPSPRQTSTTLNTSRSGSDGI